MPAHLLELRLVDHLHRGDRTGWLVAGADRLADLAANAPATDRLARLAGTQQETRHADPQARAVGLQVHHVAIRSGAHQRRTLVDDVPFVDLVRLDALRVR